MRDPATDTWVEDASGLTETAPANWARQLGSFRSGATGLRGADLTVLGTLFFVPCAFLPLFQISSWTPRMMVLLLVIPAGVIALVRLVRAGDTAARWAAAALASSVVSALAADSFLASFKGTVGQDSSVVAFVGAFSLWALARFMSEPGKRLVAPTLLAALGTNLLIATIQVVGRIENGPLALSAGRAVGFTPNAVYFGALMAAGAAVCLHRLSTVSQRRGAWAAGAFAFSTGATFSGSRIALLAMVIVALYCVARLNRVSAAFGLVVAAGGTFFGTVLMQTFVSGRDAVSRIGQTQDSGGRLLTWGAASDAFKERPFVGWGLGRFRYAVQGRLSLEDMALYDGGNFFDAHNIVIGLAVAVGVPGLIFFTGFFWSTARRMSPGTGAAVAVIAMTWALQPVALTTLPIVAALLGVWPDVERPPLTESLHLYRRVMGGAVALGIMLSMSLGVVEYMFSTAVRNGDLQTMLRLEKLYIADPVVTNVVAQSLSYQVEDDRSRDEMFDAFERVTQIEPTRALWWVQLARQQGAFGDPATALESAQRARAIEPFDREAWRITRIAAEELGDEALEREAKSVLCQLGTEGACGKRDGASEIVD